MSIQLSGTEQLAALPIQQRLAAAQVSSIEAHEVTHTLLMACSAGFRVQESSFCGLVIAQKGLEKP